ncbi:MAG: excinuclease ABC subunit A, partial [Rickettsiales bacterium]
TNLSDGLVLVEIVKTADGDSTRKAGDIITMSSKFACPVSGFTLSEIEPRLFSFNSPFGACPVCDGLGSELTIDTDLIVPDTKETLRKGAIAPWASSTSKYYIQTLEGLAKHYKFSLDVPFKELDDDIKEILLYGSGDEIVRIPYQDGLRNYTSKKPYEGVIPNMTRRYLETESGWVREEISRFQNATDCHACNGYRLKPEALCVKVAGLHIGEVTKFTIEKAAEWSEALNEKLSAKHQKIAEKILLELRLRLGFLVNVGLDYLTLSRESGTLSGGESQRIRLASQIGAGLTGVLYVLDEPSIGLHQCDNERLLGTLKNLRDIGNTVIVVEHDEDTMRAADHLIDMGPGAGVHGGIIVSQGTPKQVMADTNSLTGQYLSGKKEIELPAERRKGLKHKKISIKNARANNLQNVDVDIPLGLFTVVSGVSGGGKSSLVIETLYKATMKHLHNSKATPGAHDKITGLENIDKIIE